MQQHLGRQLLLLLLVVMNLLLVLVLLLLLRVCPAAAVSGWQSAAADAQALAGPCPAVAETPPPALAAMVRQQHLRCGAAALCCACCACHAGVFLSLPWWQLRLLQPPSC